MITVEYYQYGYKYTLDLTIEQVRNELRAYGFSRNELSEMSNEQMTKEIQNLYSLCVK